MGGLLAHLPHPCLEGVRACLCLDQLLDPRASMTVEMVVGMWCNMAHFITVENLLLD